MVSSRCFNLVLKSDIVWKQHFWVFNDILLANDSGNFVLLDLTAAFDMVEYSILISCLYQWVGNKGAALDWFLSYLADRIFCVGMGNFMSPSEPLCYAVPQGSILGPLIFFSVSASFGFYLEKTWDLLSLLCCQMTVRFIFLCIIIVLMPSNLWCLNDIKAWMLLNLLSFNEKKTEVILFGPSGTTNHPRFNLAYLEPYVKGSVSNFWVIMDSDIKLNMQVSTVVQKSFFHLRQIAKLKPFVTKQDFGKVIHAFITTRLDFMLELVRLSFSIFSWFKMLRLAC